MEIIQPKTDIHIQKLSITTPRVYPNDYEFTPLYYNKKPIIIQTEYLYIPYGLNNKYDKKTITIQCNNSSMKTYEQLNKIHKAIDSKYNNLSIEILQNKSSLRLKVTDPFHIYDSRKNRINTIQPNAYGRFLLHLSGYWIHNDELYIQWFALQSQIMTPIYLDTYSFIDAPANVRSNIPIPPPLPIFKKKPFAKKLVKNVSKKIPVKPKNHFEAPSILDIQSALRSLKKSKNNI
jgi:hypothetical protein